MTAATTTEPFWPLYSPTRSAGAPKAANGPATGVSQVPQQLFTASEAPIESWLDEVLTNADRLMALKPGWDGPGSVSISYEFIARVIQAIRTALSVGGILSAPHLAPGGDGSVQIEWHEKHGELEFDMYPDGKLLFWMRDHNTCAELEGEDEKALDLFFHWAPWIASQRINARHVPFSAASIEIET